jgi:hypothetical protein
MLMIVIADPGAATTNAGDRIIAESINLEFVGPLRAAGHEVKLVPMHGRLSDHDRELLREAEDVVVCGTNLLSDHMRFRRAWHWSKKDIELCRGRLTFLGVGWWQYQRSGIDPISAVWLRHLAGDKPWAVRDQYSVSKLRLAGLEAVHLSCPTLWSVRKQILPSTQDRVVMTFTDYGQDPLSDSRLIRIVNEQFDDVVFWPQGPGDAEYIERIRGGIGTIVGGPLENFDAALSTFDTAYVGLRLHGGIRAMQKNIPSLILSIDNRAREISSSVGLRAPSRHAAREYLSLLRSGSSVVIDVPSGAVRDWKALWGIESR